MEAEQRLPRTLYEAETAYLSCYQELSNPLAVGTAYYISDSECSGGMKAVNLGNTLENDLQWCDVFVQQEGEYNVTIRCSSFDNKATLFVSANNGKGQRF
ncbi:MAG: alpha-galactosidase, partial [Bacteroidaceae bacterium]|nr:alpha-galactosidase [Bacteroidaceae bacterium]